MVKFSVLAMLLAATSMSCSSDSGSDSDATPTTASATSFDQLNLNALSVDYPDSLEEEVSSLALAGRSREACEIGSLLNMTSQSFQTSASLFCHLGVEKDNIAFGTKYKLVLQAGSELNGDEEAEDFRIFIDDSQAAAGQIKVSTCNGDNLFQVVTITGVGETSSKGTISFRDDSDFNFDSNVQFDLGFTTPGTDTIYSEIGHTNGNDSYYQQLSVQLVEGGVSTINVSSSGTNAQGHTFNHAGAAKMNDTYGNAIFAFSLSGYSGMDATWVRRAYFDSEGSIVSSTASDAFSTGGELNLVNSDVPAALSSVSADAYSGEWDCQYDETLTINMAGANGDAHNACDAQGDRRLPSDCSSGYTDGTVDANFNQNERGSAENFDRVN